MYQNAMYRDNSGNRFFWAPFVVGGLAGTALGYGIANNNYNRPNYGFGMPCCPMYYQGYPMYTNNYYYRKKR